MTLCRSSGSDWNTDRCMLPSPAWPAPRRPTSGAARAMTATVARYSGTDARGTTTSMMSFAPFCFATQNAFSRASSRSAAEARRQDVHVERAELGEQLGDRDRVLVDAVGVVLLDARRRGTPTSRPASPRGMPRSRPTFAVVATMLSASMYSRISGFTPLFTMRGTAADTSASVLNGASTVAVCAGRG